MVRRWRIYGNASAASMELCASQGIEVLPVESASEARQPLLRGQASGHRARDWIDQTFSEYI